MQAKFPEFTPTTFAIDVDACGDGFTLGDGKNAGDDRVSIRNGTEEAISVVVALDYDGKHSEILLYEDENGLTARRSFAEDFAGVDNAGLENLRDVLQHAKTRADTPTASKLAQVIQRIDDQRARTERAYNLELAAKLSFGLGVRMFSTFLSDLYIHAAIGNRLSQR